MKCDEFVGRIDRSRRERDGKERDVRCDRCRSSRFARLSRPSPRASTTDECVHQSHRIHSTRVRACIRARDGRGRRCIHTVIPYILTRNTRVFDSYHHRPCMFSKTCMHDRFVPRIETQYVRTHAAVVWFGRHTRHDTHTYIVLYFTIIRIYCPRSTPYTKYKRARPRHAVNQSRTARIRRRDVARETGDERATTTWENERTNAFVVVSDSDETGRDRESFTRESSVSGKSIGRERRKSQRARNSFTHSLIHSVR